MSIASARMCMSQATMTIIVLVGNIYFQTMVSAVQADEGSANPSASENWVRTKLSKGEEADLNQRCNSDANALDPTADDPRWNDGCRILSVAFLHDLIVEGSKETPILSFQSVRIKGARFANDSATGGGLVLENAFLKRPLEVRSSRFDGTIDLRRARTDSLIALDASVINGSVEAEGLRSTSDLSLSAGAHIVKRLDLSGARIEGSADMRDAVIGGPLDAKAIRVSGNFDLSSTRQGSAHFGEVVLHGAKIGGDVRMAGSRFDGAVEADGLQAGSMTMQASPHFAETFTQSSIFESTLSLAGAHLTGNLDMRDVRVSGNVDCYAIKVDGNLSVQKGLFSGTSGFALAQVGGVMDLNNSEFKERLDAYLLRVSGYVSLRGGVFADDVNMAFAKIDNNLDLRSATIASLTLSGAAIAGDFQIGSPDSEVVWLARDGTGGKLNLRNARIGNLMDTQQSWPASHNLTLNGATFEHLGGSEGLTEQDMLVRGAEWWDDKWAKLNPTYSPSPYTQLTAAFTALGDRENANEMRFLARERERDIALENNKYGTYALLTALKWVAGYGIGLHTFRVIFWVIGFAILGTLMLWFSVDGAGRPYKRPPSNCGMMARGLTWCFGASLNKLLPVITLDEFKLPRNIKLALWQRIALSALSLAGWVLGGLLVAAISGLTQSQ